MSQDKFEHLFKKVETLHDLFNDLDYLTKYQHESINHLEDLVITTKNEVMHTEQILHETKQISNSIYKKYILKNATIAGVTGLMLDSIIPFSSTICYTLGIMGVCGYEMCFSNTNLNKSHESLKDEFQAKNP